MYIIVSSCIMGENCKYSGGNNYNPDIAGFLKDKKVLKVCPELLAGLPSPRSCAELVNGMVIDEKGRNVDAAYREGIRRALEDIRGLDVEFAVLQSRSPTCGVNQIYDGTFSGRLVSGRGLFAEALIKAGYTVIDAEDFRNK